MSKKVLTTLLILAAFVVLGLSITANAGKPGSTPSSRPVPVSFEYWCTSSPVGDQADCNPLSDAAPARWLWTAEDLGLEPGEVLVIEYVSFNVYIKNTFTQISSAEIGIGDFGGDWDANALPRGSHVVETARTTVTSGQSLRLYAESGDGVRIWLELSENTTHISGYASFSGYIVGAGSQSLSP